MPSRHNIPPNDVAQKQRNVEPYLEFISYGMPGMPCPWTVENGICTPGGEYESGSPKPLSPVKWEEFLATMDELGVWKWRKNYVPTDMMVYDGHAWSLEIHDGDRHVKTGGCNGYPDARGKPTPMGDPEAAEIFRRLERAVKRLMGT